MEGEAIGEEMVEGRTGHRKTKRGEGRGV